MAGVTRFSDHLRALAGPAWEAQREHPFVRGIAEGCISEERFRHWVRQDYRFLVEYCRLFALGAARAPDLDTLARFGDLLQATARTEMELHRTFAAEFGISLEGMEREPMSPTTQGYTDFLLRTATLGDFGELAAALLPCMWGFSELGLAMAAGGLPEEPRCRAWVESYASPEFAELAAWCRDLVDRLAADAGAEARARMEAAFVTSSRYELAFWEMAWRLERWQV